MACNPCSLRVRCISLFLLWLFCPLRSAPASELKECPQEQAGQRFSTGSSREQVSVSFTNAAGVDLEFFWVNFDGVEQRQASLLAEQQMSHSSYAGHLWLARDDNGLLVFEATIADSPSQQAFEITSCAALEASNQPEVDPSILAEDEAWLAEHGTQGSAALAKCPLSALLSEIAVPGFHVACVIPEDFESLPAGHRRFCVFRDGKDAESCSAVIRFTGTRPEELIPAMAAMLRLPKRKPPRVPMALFTGSGRRIDSKEQLLQKHRLAVVLIEGGVWQWPPIRKGYVRPLPVSHGSGEPSHVQLTTLELRPRVFSVANFLTDKECDRVLEKSKPHMKVSDVSLKDADKGRLVDDWRTSQTYFLSSAGDETLLELDRHIQSLTKIPIVNSEYAQVLRYDYNGRYTAHHDYFDPRDYQKDQGLLQLTEGGTTNRVLTVFMYMSDVEEGGETVFPRSGGRATPGDYGDCSAGTRVRPEHKKVIAFYSMLPNGQLDPLSLHGGCRVKNGTKWSANFWIWNKAKSFKQDKDYREMVQDLSVGTDEDAREEEALLSLAVNGPPKHDEEL